DPAGTIPPVSPPRGVGFIPATPPRLIPSSRQAPSPSPSARSRRSRDVAALCRLRDSDRCVVTFAGEPIEVAHIYPFSMAGVEEEPRNRYSFWTILRVFWRQERVDRWYQAVFPRGTEIVDNLMCLAPSVHKYHERVQFALQPISLAENGKRLTSKTKLTMWIRIKKICSGDEIILETCDADTLPLPNWDLLEMQWVLQCIAAMSGSAEPRDESYGEDDDFPGDFPMALRNDHLEDDYMSGISGISTPSTIPTSPVQLRNDEETVQGAKTQVATCTTPALPEAVV
ncbi:hypothetical protein Egran_03180, partial [Elaphomyces granulatus]